MRKLIVSLLGFVHVLQVSRSQSFNVDFEPANTPYGRPPATYGAAALSFGYWNGVGTDAATGLVALDGSPTTVALATTAVHPNAFSTFDFAGTSGHHQALLDDFHRPDDFGYSWSFTGLAPGDYEIFTIYLANNGLWTEITVPGSAEGMQMVWGFWNGSYVHGDNYVKHTKTVTDGTILIDVQLIGFEDYGHVNGIQLVKDGEVLVGIPTCFGDGSGTPCPCGNDGVAAHGCGNSISSGGGLLTASGTTSPDTVVLHASGLPPGSASIFLQGSAWIPQTVYGDGLRCAGGRLKRLYAGTAVTGAIDRPGPFDLSITARSALLGDPIPPGARRYYQTYYRDENAGYCPPPQGSSFNATNAVRINW